MKKKFLKISVIAFLLIWVCATIVNALSFSATMTPSSSTVEPSTEFTIRVLVSNLDVGANGINTLSGIIKYDAEVFEPISNSSIEGLNSWSQSFNEATGKITLTKTTFVKTEEAVFQVTFKTKSEVTATSVTILFTNITASNSETEIVASDISTTITIGAEDTNTANESTSNTNVLNIRPVPVANNTVNNNTYTPYNIINEAELNNSTNTQSEEDLSHAGVEDTLLYVILGLIVVSTIFYIKFEKINKEIK